jgi:GNAT superfamily N-acetyltransferase
MYRPEDIEQLEQAQPSWLGQAHAPRVGGRQDSSFLIAWFEESPVGTVEIRWNGCAVPEVRERFPDCPELNGLQVWPERMRSLGIGATIIATAEEIIAGRGFARLGLGVEDGNDRAARLYLRLGYAETGCRYLDRYPVTTDDGETHQAVDHCRFLVKDLPTPATTR